MKKTLTFIPLGVGISAAIVYLFNVICFRVINNSVSLMHILSNLKIYLYISVGGFITYFIIKILMLLKEKNNYLKHEQKEQQETINEIRKDESKSVNLNNEGVPTMNQNANLYVPNYDYVPVYKKETSDRKPDAKIDEEKLVTENIYCFNCGNEISDDDIYCKNCGTYQKKNTKKTNLVLKNIINILEIVILLLVLYFSVNMLFDYKESVDPKFKSPLKISMTK